MARTHSAAIAHSAGFALLHPASRPELDGTRIATLSGTLAVNLLALGMLMLPLSLPPPAPLADDMPEMQWEWLPRTPVQPPPPPVPVELVRTPPAPSAAPVAQPQAPTTPAMQSTPVLVREGPAIDLAADGPATIDEGATTGAATAAAPTPMQLRYAHAPAPTYPRMALRAGIEGTVMLQVLVDVDGRPLEVIVMHGSGHRALDAAAREQVLRHWRFRPATVDGQAVQAIGLVPVEFTLR